jgi:hypothetical protein
MVETLSVPAPVPVPRPGIEGTDQKAANKGTTFSHGGDHPGPEAREQGGSAEENTQGKRKNRGASGEKRAILQQEAEAERGTSKRSNPYDDKASVKKNKDPRPNPF